jgi:hypothetical protein
MEIGTIGNLRDGGLIQQAGGPLAGRDFLERGEYSERKPFISLPTALVSTASIRSPMPNLCLSHRPMWQSITCSRPIRRKGGSTQPVV